MPGQATASAILASSAPESDATPVRIAVTVRDLSCWYGDFQAIHSISLDVPQCRVTALIGPSGCGKSTFLRAINRMNDLIPGCRVDGELTLDGQDLNAPQVDVVSLRKMVGMVFQKPNPFPKSIFDNIAYGPKIHGTTDRRRLGEIVERSLKQAALWDEVKDRLDDNALGLSGGQQQRLCLARAVAVNPKVLLMDEPASALDPIATLRIEELMFELKADYSITIVTHNMQQAARVSDRTAFFSIEMDEAGQRTGRLVEFNDTGSLFTNPDVQETEDYITGRFG